MEKAKMTASFLKEILERVPNDAEVFVTKSLDSFMFNVLSVSIVHFVDKDAGEIKQRIELHVEDE